MNQLFLSYALLGFFSTALFADSSAVVSDRGATFTWSTQTPVTQETQTGVICSTQPMQLKSVKLWMGAHHHGSTPTSVAVVNDHCGRVDQLNFLMAGRWDIQVETVAGEKAVFGVDVP